MSDEQIRQLAEKSGMWGVDDWWKQEIPRLRKFLELAAAEHTLAPDGALVVRDSSGVVTCSVCGTGLGVE